MHFEVVEPHNPAPAPSYDHVPAARRDQQLEMQAHTLHNDDTVCNCPNPPHLDKHTFFLHLPEDKNRQKSFIGMRM